MTETKPRILLVDDEAPVLRGLERQLFRSFQLGKATSAAQALQIMLQEEPFDVVVSDMRMPEVNGAEFLSIVRQKWPGTMRIVLTGHSDLEAAAKAINEGAIFRFLLKPCVPQSLIKALNDAVEHRRLLNAEQRLLEETLVGSVRALTEIMSIVSPESFGLANKCRDVMVEIAMEREEDEIWSVEMAAMLSQLRCATLAPELLTSMRASGTIDTAARAALRRGTTAVDQVLGNIPRLDSVREILVQQDLDFVGTTSDESAPSGADIPWPARLLRILHDGETLRAAGKSESQILETLAAQKGVYDPKLLRRVYRERDEEVAPAAADGLLRLPLVQVAPGMVLEEPLRTTQGSMLVQAGQQISEVLLERIKNIGAKGGIVEPVIVRDTGIAAL